MSDTGAITMPARKSTEPTPEPEKSKRGRPKEGDPRPADRIIIKGKDELVRKWRAYVKRRSPFKVPNASLVFWELFERALAEEKAAKENPKSE